MVMLIFYQMVLNLKRLILVLKSGGTFVYMAFAEAPFVNSKGVPANAR